MELRGLDTSREHAQAGNGDRYRNFPLITDFASKTSVLTLRTNGPVQGRGPYGTKVAFKGIAMTGLCSTAKKSTPYEASRLDRQLKLSIWR